MENNDNQPKRGMMFISFGSYLKKIEAMERAKPKAMRKPIPSLRELARSIDSNSSTLSRLYRGDLININIKLAGEIIREMRLRGFPMEVTDLIDYAGPPPAGQAELDASLA